MKSEIEINQEDGLCIWRVSGRLTLAGLREGYGSRFDHPDWRPSLKSLAVLENVELGDISIDQASAFIEYVAGEVALRQSHAPVKAAIVCADPLAQGMLAYFRGLAGNVVANRQEVFTTEDEARVWLADNSR